MHTRKKKSLFRFIKDVQKLGEESYQDSRPLVLFDL